MVVVIDGVEYTPMHSASGKDGKIKSVANLIADARDHEGLTLERVAQMTGMKVNKVHRAECGEVTLDTAIALCDFYRIPLDQLARSVRGK